MESDNMETLKWLTMMGGILCKHMKKIWDEVRGASQIFVQLTWTDRYVEECFNKNVSKSRLCNVFF